MTKTGDYGIEDGIKSAAAGRREMVPAKEESVANRVAGGLLGTGMIAGQLPLLRRYAAGRATLYHATSPDAAHSIVSSPMGIDPAYAGVGVRAGVNDHLQTMLESVEDSNLAPEAKKARINRYLMGESLNRVLEGSGVKMAPGQMAKNLEDFNVLMDRGVRASEAAKTISDQVMRTSVAKGVMTQAQAKGVSEKLMKELPSFGLRSYFGTHPSQVMSWASGKSESQLAINKAVKNNTASSHLTALADAMSGGWVGNINDARERFKYKPAVTENITSSQLAGELDRVRAAHAAGRKSGVIFGVSAPTRDMGYLNDFPVVKHLVNLNPGLKPSLRQFVETYEPGRDLSLPHNVPTSAIKSVDIVDHATGQIRRLSVTDAQRAVASGLGSRLKRMAIPAAIAGLGAALTYRALRPPKRMVPVGDPYAAKTASVASDVLDAAKYIVPIGAAGTAVGIGAHKVMRHLMPAKPVDRDDIAGQAGEAAKKGMRGLGSSLIGAGAGTLAGVVAAAALRRKFKDIPISRLMVGGAGVGMGLGMMASQPGVAGSESGMSPEMDPFLGMTPQGVRDKVRKNPWLAGLGYGALATAVPVGGLYTLRKYYPGTYERARMAVTQALKS